MKVRNFESGSMVLNTSYQRQSNGGFTIIAPHDENYWSRATAPEYYSNVALMLMSHWIWCSDEI